MNSETKFILKVLLLSVGVSVLIKYGGPLLSIPATSALALIVVFVPTLVVAIGLGWRSYNNRQID